MNMSTDKRKKAVFDSIWQDRDIKFDGESSLLRLRVGEFLIERIDNIEDTKGSNEEKGVLKVTNLRLIWQAYVFPKINLSIGYKSIDGIKTKTITSHLRGQLESLHLTARIDQAIYEFLFTSSQSGNARLFTTVMAVHRAYETSTLYREFKIRGAILQDEELKLLPHEEQYDKVEGVWNLGSDQGNLGYFIITNIRLVWFSSSNHNFNVSLPYLQMRSCKMQDSRFGLALVITTYKQSDEHVLGYRIDPPERLEKIVKEIKSLRSAYNAKPLFGVEFVKELPTNMSTRELTIAPVDDDIEIDSKAGRPDAFAAYFADGTTGTGGRERGPVFSEELGLAIERLKDGFTLKDLWEINAD